MNREAEMLPSLVDPITYEAFSDPVTASDNHTYERAAIADWLEQCSRRGEPKRSPLTHEAMTDAFKANSVVKWLAEEAQEMHGSSGVALSLLASESALKSAEEEAEERKDEPLSTRTLTSSLGMLDPVRHIVADIDVDAPQLVVLGDANSGKSALLERLTMLPVFPTASGLCTRLIVKVCLRQGPLSLPRVEVHDMRTEPPTIKSSVTVAVELAADKMLRLTEREVREENSGRLAGVSRNSMLVVHMQSPTLPNLDVVDLPGLVAHKMGGEPADMAAVTRRLVESYVDAVANTAFFVVAIPAMSEPSQSIALDIIRQRRLTQSTIAVLTKCDLLDVALQPGKQFSQALQRSIEDPSLTSAPLSACVATMTKPTGTVSQSAYERLKQQANAEVEWFQQRGLNLNRRDKNISSDAVVLQMSRLYNAQLRSSTWLAAVVDRLKTHQTSLQEQEQNLGLPRAHDHQTIDMKSLLSEATQLLRRTTPAHLAAPFHRVLGESEFAGQRVWELQAWEYTSTREKLCREHCDKLRQQVLACESVLLDQLLLPLVQDQSPLKMGRFEGVLSAIQTAAVRIVQAWRKHASDQVVHVAQQFYARRPSPYFAVAHSLAEGSPTITLRIDYSRLQDEIILETFNGIDAVYQRLADRLPHDPHRWFEKCAHHRKELIQELAVLEKDAQLEELFSVVQSSSPRPRAEATLELLHEYVQEVATADASTQLAGMKDIRSLLAKDDAVIDKVVDSGVLPRVVQLMHSSADEALQLHACEVVTNLAARSGCHSDVLVEANALEGMVQLLASSNHTACEQATTMLSNMTANCAHCRDSAIQAGVVPATLSHLTYDAPVSTLRMSAGLLQTLSAPKPAPELKHFMAALPHLANLIMSQDEQVIASACLALFNISSGSSERVQAVLDTNTGRRLVELLLHNNTEVQGTALRAVGSICRGASKHVQYMLNLGVLAPLGVMLTKGSQDMKRAACLMLSDISSTTDTQIQTVVDADVFSRLILLLRTASNPVREAAAMAIASAMKHANQVQLSFLVQREHVLPPLIQLLDLKDAAICGLALDSLDALLIAGQRIASTMRVENPYVGALRVCGAPAKLELKARERTSVGNKAETMMRTYFSR